MFRLTRHAHNATYLLAFRVPIVQGNDQATQEVCEKQVRLHGAEAMKMLRDDVAKGYKDATRAWRAADLDPLREREDIGKLLAELESGAIG